MLRFYYFGCRGSQLGHYIHGEWSRSGHHDTLENGFPVHLLDGTFVPIDTTDRSWKLTHLRYGSHIVSIIACHDNTIDKRGGSNAAFVVVDSRQWDATSILENARKRFPDCWERLKDVKVNE